MKLLNHAGAIAQPGSGPVTRTAPPRCKMAFVNWLGAYAQITLILGLLGPAMARWPLPLRTLVVSVLMVVGLTWLVVPALTRIFKFWLFRAAN